MNAGGNLANCRVRFFNPDGSPKRLENIEKDGRPIRTNLNGEISVSLRPNSACDIEIPGDEDDPVRCWVCITCDQPNVHSFAKIFRRTETGRVPLIYPCCRAGRFFTIQSGGLCPVRDQFICVANTERRDSAFFLALYGKDGEMMALRTIPLVARNCRCLSLRETFPEFSENFDGWVFAQLEFDGAVKSYAVDLDGNISLASVVENN